MYIDTTLNYHFGHPDGVQTIKAKTGFHQGDVLGTLLYCITVQKLIDLITKDIQTNFFPDQNTVEGEVITDRLKIHFYVDDGTIVATPEILMHIIRTLTTKPYVQEDFGFVMNPKKSAYLMSERQDTAKALELKERLIEMGFQEDVIKVHPHNAAEGEPLDPEGYGIKVLGSFVGSDEFVQARLAAYAEELYQDLLKLRSLDQVDPQAMLLLFRICFCAKPLHIFRTLPSRLTSRFAEEIETHKKEFVAHLLKIEPSQFTDELYMLTARNIDEGGLGFHDTRCLKQSAYCASLVNMLRMLTPDDALFTRIADEGWPDAQMADLREDLGEIGLKEDLEEAVMALRGLKSSPEKGTVQAQMTNLVLARQEVKIREHLLTTEIHPDGQGGVKVIMKAAGTRSRMRKSHDDHLKASEAASAWLKAVPKQRNLRLEPAQFRVALRMRYLLPQSGYRQGDVCSCLQTRTCAGANPPRTEKYHPRVDPLGLHYAHGCGKDGVRSQAHDLLVSEMQSLLRYLGYRCVHEEVGRFRAEVDLSQPVDPTPNDRHRPDITVFNMPKGDPKHRIQQDAVLLDLTVTSEFAGVASGTLQEPSASAKVGARAEVAFKAKVNHYRAIDPQQKNFIVPIVFMSNGYVHEKTLQFLTFACEHAQETLKIPASNLYAYILKRLSVCLQRNFAEAYLRRTYSRNNPAGQDPEDAEGETMTDWAQQ